MVAPVQTPDKKTAIPEGKGVKLGDCPASE